MLRAGLLLLPPLLSRLSSEGALSMPATNKACSEKLLDSTYAALPQQLDTRQAQQNSHVIEL